MMTRSTVGPHLVRCLRTVPSVAAVVLALVATLLGSATPAAALTKPVINGPVFNDPLGTPAQQKAIFTQLVQLIDATPPGAQIRGSMYEFNDQEVANALLAANARGVDVKPSSTTRAMSAATAPSTPTCPSSPSERDSEPMTPPVPGSPSATTGSRTPTAWTTSAAAA